MAAREFPGSADGGRPPNWIFRIFVSSTFSDLSQERNDLQKYVFPKLRELCERSGCRFQAIDLRWGVSEEASLDHQTMNICLEEIRRCQEMTPRPNFLVILGDRYGWCPLPSEISAQEFRELEEAALKEGDRDLLHQWYRYDGNAVPPVYNLLPREGNFRQYDEWLKVESRLRSLFAPVDKNIPGGFKRQGMPLLSATEQEIINGALRVPDAREHVFCFFREIKNFNDPAYTKSANYDKFIDRTPEGKPDHRAHGLLRRLKKRLGKRLPGNVHRYGAEFLPGGMISSEHIGSLPDTLEECLELSRNGNPDQCLCLGVWKRLSEIILKEISRIEETDPLQREIGDQEAFREKMAGGFCGRAAELRAIREYIQGSSQYPLIVYGAPGSGKSALLAQSAGLLSAEFTNSSLVFRSFSLTPESSTNQRLLLYLCRQIHRIYGREENSIPVEPDALAACFRDSLNLACANQPMILFLDGVEETPEEAMLRDWFPLTLPSHIKVICSTSPGLFHNFFAAKLPPENSLGIGDLTSEEATSLFRLWLEKERRTLQPTQWSIIERCLLANRKPLYLKWCFESARAWKSWEKTPLEPASAVPQIQLQVLEKLASEKKHGRVLVSKCIQYLSSARTGLREDELLDLLSNDAEVLADFRRRSPESPRLNKLPFVVWSRLYAELRPFLETRRAGRATVLQFSHRQIAEHYTTGPEETIEVHRLHASYFGRKVRDFINNPLDLGVPDAHALAEYPFQIAQSGGYREFADIMSDVRYLDARCSLGDPYELAADFQLGRDVEAGLLEEFRCFVRKHAQRLVKHRNLLFTLIIHEGFPRARSQVERLINAGAWKKPCLITEAAWLPERRAGPVPEIVASYSFRPSRFSALAATPLLLFYLYRLGQIAIVNLSTGKEFSGMVAGRPQFLSMLNCTDDGQYLVAAYEDGLAEVHRLEFDPDGSIAKQETRCSFFFKLPAIERPVMKFVGRTLWYQARSGELEIVDLDSGQIRPAGLDLGGKYSAAELSGLCLWGKDRIGVLAFREGDLTRLLAIRSNGKAEEIYQKNADISALCVFGPGHAAVAFTDFTLEVLETGGCRELLHRLDTPDPPISMVYKDDCLYWISQKRTLNFWTPASPAPPQEAGTFPASHTLIIAPEGQIGILGENSVIFLYRGNGERAQPHKLLECFCSGNNGEYEAFQERNRELWFIDGARRSEWRLDQNPASRYVFARDGRGYCLAAQALGKGFLIPPGGTPILPLTVPLAIGNLAGSPNGGFWAALTNGEIFFIGPNGQYRRVWEDKRTFFALYRIFAWPEHTLCIGMAPPISSSGQDFLYFVTFFLPDRNEPGSLRFAGERAFDPEEGKIITATFDPRRKEYILLWGGGSRFKQCMKRGNPLEFLDRKEKEQSLEIINGDILDAGFSPDGKQLLVLCRTGDFLLFDAETMRLENEFASSRMITGLVKNHFCNEGPLLVIEEKAKIFLCRQIGKVSGLK